MLEWLKKKAGENGRPMTKVWIILLGAAVGIALIIFGSRATDPVGSAETDVYSPRTDETLIYREYLEGEIRTLCESVSGVKNVTAVVSLSGGYTSVYATEESANGEKYVTVGSGSNAEALLLRREVPEITGIGIVCRGGSDPAVCRELLSLLSAAYRVPSNRIYITERNE